MSLLKPIETLTQTANLNAATVIGSFDANVAGNNKALVAFIGYQRRDVSSRAVTAFTIGAQTPTLVQRLPTGSVSPSAAIIEVWVLSSPSATTEDVSIAISGLEGENAIGVHLALFGDRNLADLIGSVTTSTDAAQTKSIAITPESAGSSIIGYCSSINAERSPWTPGSDVTELLDTVIYDADSSTGRPVFIGQKDVATAEATTFDFSNDSYSDDSPTLVFELKAAPPAGTPGIPADTLQFEGAVQANLTNLYVQIVTGTTGAGTQLFESSTVTTDANGVRASIDLSATAAAVGDPIRVTTRTADGKAFEHVTTVGDIS